jgi:hypothetical protein
MWHVSGLVVCLEGRDSHGWQEAFAQAARSTTERDFNCRIFSSSDQINVHRVEGFLLRCLHIYYTYVTGVYNGGLTSVSLQHTYASSHHYHRFSHKSKRLNKSYDEHRDSPRKLACTYIADLSQ